ncbi:MAG: hypothetical protein WBG70_23810, partial [Spirulinaceae cyanobacterium]
MAKDYTRQSFDDSATSDSQLDNEEAIEDNLATVAASDSRLYSISDLTSQFNKANRTIRTWLKCIKQAYYWLPDSEIVVKEGKKNLYTTFTLSQLENIKKHLGTGESLDNWVDMVSSTMNPQLQEKTASEPIESALTTHDPYQIEVPPLPELPVLNAEIVQVDTPEILKQKSINDKLQDLIEVATART